LLHKEKGESRKEIREGWLRIDVKAVQQFKELDQFSLVAKCQRVDHLLGNPRFRAGVGPDGFKGQSQVEEI
jgi:hypothetical protein